MLSEELIAELFELVPAPQASALLSLAMEGSPPEGQWAETIQGALGGIDWESKRERIGSLLSRILPLDTLVPDCYSAWRPLVRDAVEFFGARLAPGRLLPKLIEQLQLPSDQPLEQRLIVFLARMPTLQKLGQTLARNRHLDPALRSALISLENTIEDLTGVEGRAEIERELGLKLATYEIEMGEGIRAEASVSAVIPFTWTNPATGRREPGVFKLLKPFIRAHLAEELALFQGLAEWVEAHRHRYQLGQARVREVFEDVRRHLSEEINFPQEQAHLITAAQRYVKVAGVRVPRLLALLSTPTITAMTEERGVKISEAFADLPWKRRALAARLLTLLIAVPLFAPEEYALFHADPHAGNLFVDEMTGEVVLLDWALTERLSRQDRRQFVRLALAVALRDEQAICHAIAELNADGWAHKREGAQRVQREVNRFLKQMSPFRLAGIADTIALFDRVAFAGVRFASSLVLFRKMLFTLEGVLHDIAPNVLMDPVLAGYVLVHGGASAYSPYPRYFSQPPAFQFPLSPGDWLALQWSALFFSGRLWLQASEYMRSRFISAL